MAKAREEVKEFIGGEPKQNEIMEKRQLAPSIVLFKLYVPDIASKVKAGQFVVLRADDYAERIPLTVADYDRETGQNNGHIPGGR